LTLPQIANLAPNLTTLCLYWPIFEQYISSIRQFPHADTSRDQDPNFIGRQRSDHMPSTLTALHIRLVNEGWKGLRETVERASEVLRGFIQRLQHPELHTFHVTMKCWSLLDEGDRSSGLTRVFEACSNFESPHLQEIGLGINLEVVGESQGLDGCVGLKFMNTS
jgi:hypothetical protein